MASIQVFNLNSHFLYHFVYHWFYLEKCNAPGPIDGKCGGKVRIAWTHYKQVCWKFEYSGCIKNNENVFSSLAECEKACY